jgi:hypothetical protein
MARATMMKMEHAQIESGKSGGSRMRKIFVAALTLSFVVAVGLAIAVEAPKMPVGTQRAPVGMAPGGAVPISPISNVTVKCCGGSMSSARVCVGATLKNYGTAPVTFSTKYIGMKAGECIAWDKEYCKAHPAPAGGICIDPCKQTSPPTPVVTAGPNVTVPANGTAPLNITAPNHTYVQGSKLEVQAPGKTPQSRAVPPINQCVL